MKKYNSGFTLFELVIVISVIVIMLSAGVGLFKPWGEFRDRVSTENRLKTFQQTMIAIYKKNSGVTELANEENGAAPSVGHLVISMDSSLLQKTVHGMLATECSDTMDGLVTETYMEPLFDYYLDSKDVLTVDGFRRPWCIFISNQLSTTVDAVGDQHTGESTTLYYHRMYVLSRGPNEVFDSNWDQATGILLLNQDASGNPNGGDDQATVIDGQEVQFGIYEETMLKLRNVSKSYKNYFKTQYLNSNQRDPIVNYFHNATSVDPLTLVFTPKASALGYKDISGHVPSVDRPVSVSDPLAHFAPLRVTRGIPTGTPSAEEVLYTNFDGHLVLQGLGLTESETELPTKNLPSKISHIMVNNAREESGIKTPDAINNVFISDNSNDVLNKTSPYTVELAAEIAANKAGAINRNVIKLQVGGLWE